MGINSIMRYCDGHRIHVFRYYRFFVSYITRNRRKTERDVFGIHTVSFTGIFPIACDRLAERPLRFSTGTPTYIYRNFYCF